MAERQVKQQQAAEDQKRNAMQKRGGTTPVSAGTTMQRAGTSMVSGTQQKRGTAPVSAPAVDPRIAAKEQQRKGRLGFGHFIW